MNDRPITRADLAIAFERGYWRGVDHKGPLNAAAVDARNPYRAEGITPAKACKVALKTERDRGATYQETATASEPTHISEEIL